MGEYGQYDTERFDELFQSYGLPPLKWYQRIGKCPRHTNSRTGSPAAIDFACPLCGGTKVLYRDMAIPVDGKTGGKVYVYDAKVGARHNPFPVEAGDRMVNFRHDEFPLGYGDRLKFATNIESQFSQVLERDSEGDGSSSDPLRYIPAVEILAVYGVNGEITSGFALNGTGTAVNWAAGLVMGDQYTILYKYNPSWVIPEASIMHYPRPQDGSGDWLPSVARLSLWQNLPADAQGSQR